MAGKLQESTERLVYLRQLASWQTLARKMAHEVKNSLTPIRLTVEEMLARYDEADRAFMDAGRRRSWWTKSKRWSGASGRSRNSPPSRRSTAASRGRELAAAGAHRLPEDGAPGSGLRLPVGGEAPAVMADPTW